MHASLNEDLIQPKKLEMGISHRTGGRTGHFDWGWHEITPGWSVTPGGTERIKPRSQIEPWSTIMCADLSFTEFAVKKSVL
jgi:hypothetical protein